MTRPITTREEVKQLGTVLGIWAHPDDETYSMGGLLAAAVKNGQSIACVTATKGEAGVQDESRWPSRRLAGIREAELNKAFGILGVAEHHWLDYPDGGCSDIYDEEAVGRLCSLILLYKPDSIFTFGPDGMTGHPDHKTVSRWAGLARDKAASQAKIYHTIHTRQQYEGLLEADKKMNIFFNIDQPRVCEQNDCKIYLTLDDELYASKLEALRAMPSQTEKMLELFEDSLRTSIGIEAFVEA